MNMKKVGLIILDGWGIGAKDESDAVFKAHTPVMDGLLSKFANGTLLTDGENVGLPEGQMGNSEVGHMNIGAGRVVFQDLVRINKDIREGELAKNPGLMAAFKLAKERNCKLHFMGLVSDGGVHSSQEHLHALCDYADAFGLEKVFIHAFTDGRDTDPKSGLGFIQKLEDHLKGKSAQIASVIGRYYAMDRDKRWERVKLAYDLMVKGEGEQFESATAGMIASYENDITDEFIKPFTVGPNRVVIEPDDVVVCFNFRTDRCREITQVLTQSAFPEYNMSPLHLGYFTMTKYDETFKNVHVLYEKDDLKKTLGEVVSDAGLRQVRIAETEKYPHVTFFFSGGREAEFPEESRLMAHSPKVATYDLQPEMSAGKIVELITPVLENESVDFFCLNFANPDMVGHTGVFSAIVRAVEYTDECLGEVIRVGREHGYSFIVIADHGNADFAINPDGSPNTAHSLNPVPFVVVDSDIKKVRSGILADVAPTVLSILGVDQPVEMTGRSLIDL